MIASMTLSRGWKLIRGREECIFKPKTVLEYFQLDSSTKGTQEQGSDDGITTVNGLSLPKGEIRFVCYMLKRG